MLSIKRFAAVFTLFFVGLSTGFGQTLFYNNGQEVFVNSDALVYVQNGDVENHSGRIENRGTLTVLGSILNEDELDGGAIGSLFTLTQNWTNNGLFDAFQSLVLLDGGNQLINGSSVTSFYDLEAGGTGIKTMEIDANVDGTLTLNDNEVATQNNILFVRSTDVSAILRGSGFVTSTGPGRLWRQTNSTDAYLFPLGDANTKDYRQVEWLPSSADLQTFSGRLVFTDATVEGFDLASRSSDILQINDRFFHYLDRETNGSDASVRIYYDAATDGNWSDMARWETAQWETLDFATTAGSDFVQKDNIVISNDEPHILTNLTEEVTYAIPNVFSPNGAQSENQVFQVIDAFDEVEVISMEIYNRWGEMVYSSSRDGGTSWNGFYRNEAQPTGAYSYLIQLQTRNGQELEPEEGTLTLIW